MTRGSGRSPGGGPPGSGPPGSGPRGRNPGAGGGRGEHVFVSGRRRPSSRRWLERQLNDPYVAEAQRQGFRSRAAFKLMQLDDKAALLKPGMRVVELGAAPGGWTQVATDRVAAVAPRGGRQGRVIAVDLAPMEPVPGATILCLDFLTDQSPALIRATLDGPADLVLSDMAAPATGHGRTDHVRTMALAEAAYAFAREVLAPEGAFVAKVLQGGAERELLAALKRDFIQVRHVKPPASRSDSAEVYVVATGFRGG